ncbi:MAG: histidinol-phosphate transaminase [candidate division Zixibacteria bacterium]|nr:histidinol-phosphate transaminase [candidate division Zixibacteria bacterium]
MNVKPRDIINRVHPYQPGKPVAEVQRELGLKNVIKLASNENSLGPSPKALEAMREALGEVYRYPEASGYYLVNALAQKFALAFDQIILGNGANDLVELVVKTFAGPGDNVVSAHPSFIMYKIAAMMMDAEFRATPLRNYKFDLPAMADAVDERTKVVLIANPNNPTGTIVTRAEVDAFLERMPDTVLVVLDEAYYDFVTAKDYPGGLDYVKAGRPVMAMRSFSKNYGLAGLRLGWGAADAELVAAMHRIRQPFNANRLAQVAGVAALADDEHLARSREMVAAGREQFYRGLDKLGVKYVPSEANFVLVDLEREARPVFEALMKLGVVVRPMAGWGLPNALRVSVGKAEENDAFLRALAKVLRK